MELYLIRHAQSLNNAASTEQRVADPGLTRLGHEQAGRLADCAGEWNLDRLVTSPFRRTLLTTEPIYKATGILPEVRTQLHEQGGCYSGYAAVGRTGQPGMNRSEIEQEFGYEVEDEIGAEGWWQSQPYESVEDAFGRAKALLQSTHAEFAGSEQRIAYVMHADIKMFFLDHAVSRPLTVPFNASVTRLRFASDECDLLEYNCVEHLHESMVSV